MSDTDFSKLFSNLDCTPFAAGDVVFSAGDEATVAYVVRRGSVSLRSGDTEVGVLSEGEILGELALVDGAPRSLTAVAATDAKLVPLDQAQFTRVVQYNPLFALKVMGVMAKRLRQRTA